MYYITLHINFQNVDFPYEIFLLSNTYETIGCLCLDKLSIHKVCVNVWISFITGNLRITFLERIFKVFEIQIVSLTTKWLKPFVPIIIMS